MPAIKYKKKTYAGASFPCREMTKAEYDALPDAKKMDGTVYMITDDDAGWEAERSTYDNTASGLTATNVQDALDELNSSKAAKTGISYNAGSCPDNTTLGTNGSIRRVYNWYQSVREDTRSEHITGNKVVAVCNPNFLASGHMDVLSFGKISILAIQGISTKTGSDWICKLASPYIPFNTLYFQYYLGTTAHRGHIIDSGGGDGKGAVYLDTVNTTELINAQIIVTAI